MSIYDEMAAIIQAIKLSRLHLADEPLPTKSQIAELRHQLSILRHLNISFPVEYVSTDVNRISRQISLITRQPFAAASHYAEALSGLEDAYSRTWEARYKDGLSII